MNLVKMTFCEGSSWRPMWHHEKFVLSLLFTNHERWTIDEMIYSSKEDRNSLENE